MCQTCYDRGYKDYPNWVGSAPHPEYYQKGFNAHQAETGEAGHYAESVDFCETCYDRGYEDGVKDYWSPPTTPKSGHKESYKEGFNSVKAKRDEKERQEEEYQQRRQQQQQREKPKSEQFIRQITSSNSDEYVKNLLIKFGAYLVAGALILFAVLWIVSMVVILSLINLATIALVAGLTKKEWSKALFSVSILGLIFIILDHNNGWVTHALAQNASFLKGAMPFFYYLNIASGLVAAYFLIRDYLNEKTPATENEQEFSKRNLIVMGSLVLLGGLTIGGQKYFDNKTLSEIPLIGSSSPGTTPASNNSPFDYDRIFVGTWTYKENGNTNYLKVDKDKSDRFVYSKGYEYEGKPIYNPFMLDKGENIYLTGSNGKLIGKFISNNFYATHGQPYSYEITFELNPNVLGQLVYSEYCPDLDKEPNKYEATKFENIVKNKSIENSDNSQSSNKYSEIGIVKSIDIPNNNVTEITIITSTNSKVVISVSNGMFEGDEHNKLLQKVGDLKTGMKIGVILDKEGWAEKIDIL
jgi:hypothetical protein